MVASGTDLSLIKQNSFKNKKKRNTKYPLLPKNLVELELTNFNGYLPTWTRDLCYLKRLRLMAGCKIIIRPGCLPPTLTHLTWGTNQELKPNVLPHGLLVLKIIGYSHSTMALPSTLNSLYIKQNPKPTRYFFNYICPGMLPEKLKILHLDYTIALDPDAIPSSLTKIIFGIHYDKSKRPVNLSNNIICHWL